MPKQEIETEQPADGRNSFTPPPAATVLLFPAMALLLVCVLPLVMGWLPRDGQVTSPPVYQIDINTTDHATLQLLPGVGPALADRIIMEREEEPFASVDDLRRVNGIGQVVAGRLANHVRCGPASP